MAEIIEYTKENAGRIAALLKKGKVGAVPCDTIYGLSAVVGEEGSKRIYELKKRPKNKSFIVLMTKNQLQESSLIVPDDIFSLWPCALTAVLSYPDGSTLAVRVPDDELLEDIITLSGPIYSTSVNVSGEKSMLTFSEINSYFGDKLDFIAKTDKTGEGKSSTLVDVTKKPYRILREGSYKFSLI